jgi:hypothetical protein
MKKTKKTREVKGALAFGLVEIVSRLDLYDFELCVVIGPAAGLQEYARWKFEDPRFDLRGPYHGLHLCKRGYPSVIWLPRRPRTPTEISTLSHEVLHVVRRLFEWVGIPLTRDTDEAYCYALGHLVKDVLTQFGCRGAHYGKEITVNT